MGVVKNISWSGEQILARNMKISPILILVTIGVVLGSHDGSFKARFHEKLADFKSAIHELKEATMEAVKDKKQKDTHIKGGPGVSTKCHIEHDLVWVEECGTKFDNTCEMEIRPVCTTVSAKECIKEPHKKCKWEMDSRCKALSVPSCSVKWEQRCTKKPICSTVEQKQCNNVEKDVCVTHNDKVCTMTDVKVCRKTAVREEVVDGGVEGAVSDFKAKGDGQKASKIAKKHSLLDKWEDHIDEKAEKIRAKLMPSLMKGLKGETQVIPDTAAQDTLEASSRSEEGTDEIEPEPETEVNDSGFKHFTEKPTIEAETSEKEESKTEDSTETTKIVKRNANEQKASKIAKKHSLFDKWEDHIDEKAEKLRAKLMPKIAKKAQKSKTVKRHADELDEFDQEVLRSVLEFDEFYTEIEAENDSEKGDFETEASEEEDFETEDSEEGDFETEDSEESGIVKRHTKEQKAKKYAEKAKKSKIVKRHTDEYQAAKDKKKAAIKAAKAQFKAAVWGKGNKGKDKGDKGKNKAKAGPTLKTKFVKTCDVEPRQTCKIVPRNICHKEVVPVCTKEPVESCYDKEHCKSWPIKNCEMVQKNTCWPFPTQKCEVEQQEVCKYVPRQNCVDKKHEVCRSTPVKDCQKRQVSKPRQVCVPEPTIRMEEDW